MIEAQGCMGQKKAEFQDLQSYRSAARGIWRAIKHIKQVATASYGHRYPRPARLKVASVEVSRAAALEGPMRRF